MQQCEIHTQYNHPEVMEAAQKVVDAIDGAIAQQEREVQHGG